MATDWHVEYQDERMDFSAAGRAVNVVDIHFIVDTDPGVGHRGSVTVEATRYSPDLVAGLIQQKVDAIKAIAGL